MSCFKIKKIDFDNGVAFKNPIPVVFTLDNNFILLFLVALYSLFANSKKSSFFDIFIVHSLSEKNISKIINYCHKYKDRCCLNFIDIDDEKLKFVLDISKARKYNNNYSYYYRLFLSDIITGYDKIVYSDVDVLFMTDLKDMYDIDIGDNYVGAIQLNHNAKSTNMIKDDDYYYFTKDKDFRNKYFATGNIILNLKAFRENHLISKYQSVIDLYKDDFIYTDQDIINYLSYDKVCYIPLNWCVNYSLIFQNNNRYFGEDGNLSAYDKKDIEDAIKNPCIIHYTGKKPDVKIISKENSFWLKYLYEALGIKGYFMYGVKFISFNYLSKLIKLKNLFVKAIKNPKELIKKIIKIVLPKPIVDFGKLKKDPAINLKNYKKINYLNKKDIALFEFNNYHLETLICLANYFERLGKRFDVFININCQNTDSDMVAKLKEITNVYFISGSFRCSKLEKIVARNYNRIFINSCFHSKGKYYLKDLLPSICRSTVPVSSLVHRNEFLTDEIKNRIKTYPLVNNINYKKDDKLVVCNFEIEVKNKCRENKFLTVGRINNKIRDFDSLIDNAPVNKTVIIGGSCGFEDLKEKITEKFDKNFIGRVSFTSMCQYCNNTDFILFLIHPDKSEEQKRYLRDGITGSLNLVLGFGIIPIIEKQVAEVYGFDESSAIIYYKSNGFKEAIKKAEKLDKKEIEKMRKIILEKKKLLESKTLEILKRDLK